MATEATFNNQLQALATATANFANGKDAAIKNTIITALGGSTQSGGNGTLTVNTENLNCLEYSVSDIDGGKRITFGSNGGINTPCNGYIDVTLG